MKLMLDLEKSTLNTSKLVKKPVQVRGKDGKTHTRMQWVKPGEEQTDPKTSHKEATKEPVGHKPAEPEPHHTKEKYKLEVAHPDDKPYEGNPENKASANKEKKPVFDSIDLQGLEPIMDSISPLGEANIKDTLSKSRDAVLSNWNDMSRLLEKDIKKKDIDRVPRLMQIQALRDGDMRHNYAIAAHPEMARKAVESLVGEENAKIMREQMNEANLTVNFSVDASVITENGYIASTDESYAREHMDEEGFEEYMEYKESEDASVDGLYELDIPGIYDLSERAEAEQNAFGAQLDDPKPTYIAFNPMNNVTGGTSAYGQSWLRIKDAEDVLKSCTVTMDDSFVTSNSFATVYSMDHLKDIYILKALDNTRMDNEQLLESISKGETDWAHFSYDIPLELQYHKPKLEPDQFEIIKDGMNFVHADYKHHNPTITGINLNDIGISESDLDKLISTK